MRSMVLGFLDGSIAILYFARPLVSASPLMVISASVIFPRFSFGVSLPLSECAFRTYVPASLFNSSFTVLPSPAVAPRAHRTNDAASKALAKNRFISMPRFRYHEPSRRTCSSRLLTCRTSGPSWGKADRRFPRPTGFRGAAALRLSRSCRNHPSRSWLHMQWRRLTTFAHTRRDRPAQ